LLYAISLVGCRQPEETVVLGGLLEFGTIIVIQRKDFKQAHVEVCLAQVYS